MTDYNKLVGENIKTLREGKGLSQHQLAVKCGHDTENARSWISKIESGKRGTTIPEISTIGAALDVPPGTLFLEIEIKESNTMDKYNRLLEYAKLLSAKIEQ